MKIPFTRNHTYSSITCDICLIVHDTALLHAERQDLVAQTDESLLRLTPAELAAAARRLLPNTDKQQRIALGLPGDEFVATTVHLPGVNAQNFKNAVSLQLPTLLPGITESLLLAVRPPVKSGTTVALWIPSQRAEELFKAFDKVGLFLIAILPRTLVALPYSTAACQIIDEDATAVTYLEWSGDTIQKWLHLPKADYENSEFQHQWEQALTGSHDELLSIHKTTAVEWQNIQMPSPVVCSHAFIPPSAVLRLTQAAKRKRNRWWSIAAGLIVLCVIIAIGMAAGYKYRLKKQLAELKSRTLDISHFQMEVLTMETAVAPIQEFPRQHLIDILTKLNNLLPKEEERRSWISSFRIEAGTVEIEGYSPNPANLLEILAAEPTFVEVAFSRPTRNEPGRKEEGFGIKFKITGIDLRAYWEKFFPQH